MPTIEQGTRQLLTTRDVAKMLGLSERTLEKMRLTGDGPPYRKLGRRSVRYDLTDIDEWIEESRRRSTSDTGHAPWKRKKTTNRD